MKKVFVEGAIPAEKIAKSIDAHKHKQEIGAHEIFLGQVRRDQIEGKEVEAIEYTAYEEMAQKTIHEIREKAFDKFPISCLHIYHSLGLVKTGELCFFVFVSAPHREAAREACKFLVDSIKKEAPIFGKEVFEDGAYKWKVNRQ